MENVEDNISEAHVPEKHSICSVHFKQLENLLMKLKEDA